MYVRADRSLYESSAKLSLTHIFPHQSKWRYMSLGGKEQRTFYSIDRSLASLRETATRRRTKNRCCHANRRRVTNRRRTRNRCRISNHRGALKCNSFVFEGPRGLGRQCPCLQIGSKIQFAASLTAVHSLRGPRPNTKVSLANAEPTVSFAWRYRCSVDALTLRRRFYFVLVGKYSCSVLRPLRMLVRQIPDCCV